jgi:hypothetical protein
VIVLLVLFVIVYSLNEQIGGVGASSQSAICIIVPPEFVLVVIVSSKVVKVADELANKEPVILYNIDPKPTDVTTTGDKVKPLNVGTQF